VTRSSQIQVGERTLYPAIVDFLGAIGFSVGSEIRIGTNFVDILFRHGHQTFVLEIKIDSKNSKLA